MVVSLRWKEKVVHSTLVLFAFVFSFVSAYSQSTQSITFTYNAVTLKKLVENLARISGRHIIYSSDKIDLTATLSLAVRNKTVEEILLLIEKKANLSFTMLDHHIIIKQSKSKRNLLAASREAVPMQPAVVTAAPSNNHLFASKAETKTFGENISISNETLLAKNLKPVSKLSAKTILISLPGKYIPRINRDNIGLFISAGALINDYSAGFELRAGLPRIYAVFSPSWTKNGLFNEAYGLGTWFPLSSRFSVNSIYAYSKVVQKDAYTIDPSNPMSGQVEYQSTTNHHQFKLRLQYALSKNVRLELGPTFNQSNTRSILQESYIQNSMPPHTIGGFSYSSKFNGPEIGGEMNPGTVTTFSQVNQISPQAQSASKFWIGWEASISYRVNFSYRK